MFFFKATKFYNDTDCWVKASDFKIFYRLYRLLEMKLIDWIIDYYLLPM